MHRLRSTSVESLRSCVLISARGDKRQARARQHTRAPTEHAERHAAEVHTSQPPCALCCAACSGQALTRKLHFVRLLVQRDRVQRGAVLVAHSDLAGGGASRGWPVQQTRRQPSSKCADHLVLGAQRKLAVETPHAARDLSRVLALCSGNHTDRRALRLCRPARAQKKAARRCNTPGWPPSSSSAC
jgi:hypothetical protein